MSEKRKDNKTLYTQAMHKANMEVHLQPEL